MHNDILNKRINFKLCYMKQKRQNKRHTWWGLNNTAPPFKEIMMEKGREKDDGKQRQ